MERRQGLCGLAFIDLGVSVKLVYSACRQHNDKARHCHPSPAMLTLFLTVSCRSVYRLKCVPASGVWLSRRRTRHCF